MSEYKRLTAKKEDRYWEQEEFWQSAEEPSYEKIEEIYNRLAELEDKIESRKLVELPCNVGDKVYRKDGDWTVFGFDCNRANGWKVKLERWKNKYLDEHETTKIVFSSFGKTVFFTEEEVRLKELQENKGE